MKLSDRLLVGACAGLGGNVLKWAATQGARKLKWIDVDGPEKAAGMLIPPHQIRDPIGKAVGYLGDSIIAASGGVLITYMLSATGAKLAPLKGAMMGEFLWTFAYGALASAGVSKVQTGSAKNALADMGAHTLYGTLAGFLCVLIADPGLYNGQIPLGSYRPSSAAQNRSPKGQQRAIAKGKLYRVAVRRSC